MIGERAPRIPLLPEELRDDEVRAALKEAISSIQVAKLPNATTTVLHLPDLAGRLLAHNGLGQGLEHRCADTRAAGPHRRVQDQIRL